MNNRRQILRSLLSLSATGLLPYTISRAQTPADFGLPTLPRERFHRTRLGDIEIIALHDGATRLTFTDRYVTNANFAEVKALARSLGLTTDYVELTFTGFLIVAGQRRVLLDAGLGDMGTPRETTGNLVNSLRLAGFKPEDIDTVLITHFHPDHISGLRSRAGEFVYPNAKVWASYKEHEYWMSDEKMKAAPERKAIFELARRVFNSMPQDMLRLYTPGQEIVPGVLSIPAYGHTPGHTIYQVVSGSQSFYYIGDMVNVPAFFLRHPEWIVASDMDPQAALEVRRRVLSQISQTDSMVGGFHFPFPAIGHLRPEGLGFTFESVI